MCSVTLEIERWSRNALPNRRWQRLKRDVNKGRIDLAAWRRDIRRARQRGDLRTALRLCSQLSAIRYGAIRAGLPANLARLQGADLKKAWDAALSDPKSMLHD